MEKINLELFKKYFWLINLVAGLMGLISAFLPSWGGEEGGNLISVWYWGFYFITEWGTLDEPAITIPGVVVAIILLVGTALILSSALLAKRKNDPKTILSLIGGIVFLVAPILFLITMSGLEATFWLEYFAGIGLILPFICGSVAIISWYSMRR